MSTDRQSETMTDHITTCVSCHDELSADRDAYCSDECKVENEAPAEYKHSHYKMARTTEVTGIAPGDQ